MGVELVDQRVLGCALAAHAAFEALQDPQPFRGGQCVETQRAQPVQHTIERVEHLDDLLAAAATHAPNLRRTTDKNRPIVATETKVAQGITLAA
ncbi:hypothetical protein [Mycobacterium conspicuum]|uniref:hypothetical protein n=1 Tax=Mycobacterium conspicuum TaxID=44010 RepID=UPI0035591816